MIIECLSLFLIAHCVCPLALSPVIAVKVEEVETPIAPTLPEAPVPPSSLGGVKQEPQGEDQQKAEATDRGGTDGTLRLTEIDIP